MNLSPFWVQFFTDRGIESVHWSAIGASKAPDSEILDYAAANDLVIFTHDLDFSSLLAGSKSRSPNIIQIRAQGILPSDMGETVISAIRGAEGYLDGGAIVTIDETRARVRILPL